MNTKRLFFKAFLMTALLSVQIANAQQDGELKMWYNKPATVWNEALPLGNGRLGAMVFGNPASEKIQLNEATFWSGGPSRNDNSDALAALPDVRQMIFSGNYSTVESVINQNFKAKTVHGAMYQPVGFLNLSFPEHSTYTNYYRELDLAKALFTTTYEVAGVAYKREVFASQPDQVIVVRLSADKPGKLTFTASVNGPLQKSAKALDKNTLELTGLSSTSEGVTGKVKFDARVKILNSGGTTAISSGKINVSNADEVVILISIATNFVDYETLTANETDKCINYLTGAETKNYDELFENHKKAFQKYFNRVKINLGSSSFSAFPTDLRIKNFSKTNDNELVAMYYQFGRYLLISASQPGGQPATLQGLWNDQVNPSWDSKYTININTEMNYWPAEKCNMPEMHEPLVKMVQELSEAGKKTATDMYGCDGWVTHHNTDIWRICGVVDGAYWGMWPMGGAWLSQHLWEKFLYNGDLVYLDSVYPVLKSACQFYQDFLVPEPKHNWMVVSPSISPENNPSVHSTSICAGATMDNQILFDLFSKTIKAAKLLNKDSDLMSDLQMILDSLPPMQIGRYGQLQEWMEDWDSPTDQHRHVSHLYGLFPGNQISPFTQPKLFEAARTSLKYRGDVSTGWSMGWKVNLWARLLDGNHARKLITDQLTLVDPVLSNSGGTYPNFFDSHPPFQIDGNFGCTSGIAEMLLQSHDGTVHFLPALPDDWKTGDISGLRTYGGFEVDFEWKDGQIEKITIKSNLGGNCRIRVPNEVALKDSLLKAATGTNPNPFFAIANIRTPVIADPSKIANVKLPITFVYDLPTIAGENYTLVRVKKPVFKAASVTSENPGRIVVLLDEPIKKQAQFSGFSVKADSAAVAIDSVVMGNMAGQLLVYITDSIQPDNKVLISYQNGNVESVYNLSLTSFTDTLVDNLLPGASPVITELKTSDDGKSLVAVFNMKMKIPSDLSAFWINAKYNGDKLINLTGCNFLDEDSTRLTFTLSEPVFADFVLTFSCSGNTLISAEDGIHKTFTGKPVANHSSGLPFKIKSGLIQSDATTIQLTFEKSLAMNIGQTSDFVVKKNGQPVSIKEMVIAGTIAITVSDKIRYGETITVSYNPGNISSNDKGILEGFDDFKVTNPLKEPVWGIIPGKIEGEKFLSQFGIQTENTGDVGGGLNISWIEDGDWMEYAVNNTSADSMFTFTSRLASPYTSGVLWVYVDDVKVGTTNVGNTGGWQTYKSYSQNVKIKPGKHYIKLFANKGGFNVNYFEIKKITTGTNLINFQMNLKVYPNPAAKEIVIESVDFEYDKIDIVDLNGKKVLSESVVYEPRKVLQLQLNDGVYFLRICNDKQFHQEKIVILNNH